jgi:hypothetical protein
VDGTAVVDGAVAVFEADTTDAATTAVAGTGMLATSGSVALPVLRLLRTWVTDTGMDRVMGTDAESGSVILPPSVLRTCIMGDRLEPVVDANIQ